MVDIIKCIPMFRSFLFVAGFSISLISCGPDEPTAAAPDANAQLIRLNNRYDSAIVKKDTVEAGRILAPGFTYTNTEGQLVTRQQRISSLGVNETDLRTGKSDDVKVSVYGTTAVMTGLFRATGTYRANPIQINERWTTVWMQTDSSWQMVAGQGTVVR